MNTVNNIKVSIVIVCMNNLKNLYPCLESIRRYTHVSYETFVVAYLFSKENLEKVKADFPWVTFIESNEIRGFSENNNLALRQAQGEYCLVVNDDTYSSEAVIDKLVYTIESLDEKVAIVSPKTLNKDGSVQHNGKPKRGLITYLLAHLKLLRYYDNHSKYTNKEGIFQTYNISGACFLIKREIFKKVGWFDERYFFCPEDIALSTYLNEIGYKCYVNADVELTHACGGTWSKIQSATMPAAEKGAYIFYGTSFLSKVTFLFISYLFHTTYFLLWLVINFFNKSPRAETMRKSHWNTISTLVNGETPKQTFSRFYMRMK